VSKKRMIPRQQIFQGLKDQLDRAREGVKKASEDVTFDDLDVVLFLARKTVQVINQGYKLKRALLLEICAFLVSGQIDLSKLDINWDGEGKMPSIEFDESVVWICQAVAERVPSDQSSIESPFDGNPTTCSELRAVLVSRLQELGAQRAVEVLAA